MRTVLLLLFAAVHLVYAAWVLVDPEAAASVSGLALDGAPARGEFRALFGGLVAAIGFLLARAPFVRAGAPVLRALAWLYAGLAAGRAVSLLADGFAPYTAVLLAAEGGFGLALVRFARGLRASDVDSRSNAREIRK